MFRARPPLLSSGQSSWLQNQKFGFDCRRYHIFSVVVCLERSPHSLMSITEELLGRDSSGFRLENRDYSRRDPLRWLRGIVYPQKLARTLPTSDNRLIGIVRSRTKATELSSLETLKRCRILDVRATKHDKTSSCRSSMEDIGGEIMQPLHV
jgi:hypothetical protein